MAIIDKEKNKNYWDNKFWAYMHDPFDKCFCIKGHEERSAEIQKVFGLTPPNEAFWKKSDGIASGFERGQIVSYHKDEDKSGAVDFIKRPILTHPTGEKNQIEIDMAGIDTSKIFEKMLEFIKKDIGVEAGEGGYSDNFKNDNEKFQIARFLYTHLVLRFRLANENVAGLGALWHRLPADTRFPDHSIWQHNALVSAINSCFELGGEDDLGMMVVSITPVQLFIEKARKLRDYWTGSIFLSYLAFVGIKWVIENLGPDHVLYPSLIDQFLVNRYMSINWKLPDGVNLLNKESDIASFPNKFLFLLPFSKSNDCAKAIEQSIKDGWSDIYKGVLNGIMGLNLDLDENEKKHLEYIFERQNEKFWDIKWGAVKMLSEPDEEEIKKLLPETSYIGNFKLLKYFNNMIADKKNYEKSGVGTLYSVSHVLCQSVLGAEKTRKQITRKEEPGEKCHLCGEFEVLHKNPYHSGMSANDYKSSVQEFWEDFKQHWEGEDGSDIKDNERLCSICTTKRLGYYFLKKDHLLSKSFKDSKNFPSTTYIALTDYFKRENLVKTQEKIDRAQKIHESDDVTTEGRDKYYAILLMDGDNMGKLIYGETIASTWESIMHPDIFEKLKKSEVMDERYTKNWREIFEKHPKRNITPSIHASISESLGDFAIYGVAKIVKKYDGRLIYAGGDDVCAILPIDNVLNCAEEISRYYTSSFKLIDLEGDMIISDVSGKFKPSKGKLSLNLGRGEGISISAGILICHHKESLKHMIRECHELLDKAKNLGGRNAVAVQLKKRSGGDRFFISKWRDKKLESFKNLIDKMGEDVSKSLAYRLGKFKEGIDAISNLKDYQEEEKNKLLSDFILTMLERSGKQSDDPVKIAENITNLIFDYKNTFTNDPLIIAGFLNNENDKGVKDDNKGGRDVKLV